jgi:hypothetical protein
MICQEARIDTGHSPRKHCGMADDTTLMEENLTAIGEAGTEIRFPLFDQFFAAFPERRPTFYNLEASSIRMTDETLQMMLGLAKGESWVEHLIAELTFTHRSYGYLPDAEYEAFIQMVVDQVAAASGASWTAAHEACWRKYGALLTTRILHNRHEWTRVMPGGAAAPA